jgi:2-polyprenyl-6-hydroxyphenyl methylase/3-demethylubiquinone-9 3-methyltransferase
MSTQSNRKTAVPPDAVAWHTETALAFDAKYESSPAFIRRRKIWREAIEHYARPEFSVLDAGCGTGVLTFLAAARCRRVLGIDASPAMIALCREKQTREAASNVGFEVLPLERLAERPGESYDLILCSSVLEYVADFWTAVDRLASRLAPRGMLLFSVPNSLSLYRLCEKAAFAVSGRPEYFRYVRHRPARRQLAAGLAGRGFGIVATHYYGWSPFGLQRLATHERLGTLVLYACRRNGE